jgi:hypothetical protein
MKRNINWRSVVLYSLGLFIAPHLIRSLFGFSYGMWLNMLGQGTTAVVVEVAAIAAVFFLWFRMLMALRHRIILHIVIALVLSSILERTWLWYMAGTGRGWMFSVIGSLLLAVMAFIVSLLLKKADDTDQ